MPISPKLWFKLQRIRAALREAFGAKERTNFDTSLRMCTNCRGLIDRNAAVCPLCGFSPRRARARGGSTPGRVMGIPIPSTATSVLVAVNILLYGVSWYMTQNHAAQTLSAAPSWGGIDPNVLFRLGGKNRAAILLGGQWWRLVTAMFLHAGLLHIGMNMWVLFDVGPMAEALFSTPKFIVVYLASGVFGFVLSVWWSPVLSIGASGAIMGLIGVLIGASFHHGSLGKEFRSQLWRWVIYILIFGLFFAVDNAAHIGGLATGLVFGYLVSEGEPQTRAAENLWSTLAVISVLIIAGSFALMALHLGHSPR